jgi:hypothetical protein
VPPIPVAKLLQLHLGHFDVSIHLNIKNAPVNNSTTSGITKYEWLSDSNIKPNTDIIIQAIKTIIFSVLIMLFYFKRLINPTKI